MTKVLIHTLALLLLGFLAVPFAQMSTVAGATMSVRHTIIAASGGAAPAGGNYGTFSFTNVRLNTRHEVAFDASLTGPPPTIGVFVGDGTTTSTIALGVNPDPAGPSFGFPFNPFIAPNGDVVFQANFSDIFTSNGKTIVPLVRNGDQAPGGGTVTPTSSFVVNDHGEIAYPAFIGGSTASQGIFRTDGTHTFTIARDDSVYRLEARSRPCSTL